MNANDLLDQNEIDILLATVQFEAKRRKSAKFAGWLMLSLFLGWFVLMTFFAVVLHWKLSTIFNPAIFVALIVAMTAVSNKQKEATKALAKYDDVRAIGAFADVLDNADKKLAMIAEDKLIQLLPKVKASDAVYLMDEQRRKLNVAIEKRSSTLACAILKAYEQIGNSDAIPYVERVSKNSIQILRKEAAVQCLPFLEQRAATEKERQTLLRASDGNTLTADPNILLRPAAYTDDTQAETLLRPVQNEEETLVPVSEIENPVETQHYTENAHNTEEQPEVILRPTH